jgi:hypothetical protein
LRGGGDRPAERDPLDLADDDEVADDGKRCVRPTKTSAPAKDPVPWTM